MRFFWLAMGFTCLALGAAGTVLPLVPTTPFVLLSAFSFARSSPRFHDWLVNHRVFGPVIRDWNRNRSISRRAKILATVAVAVTLTLSVLYRVDPLIILVQVLVFIPGMTFIWTRPDAPLATPPDVAE